jgi:hypothetical protein
VRHRRRAPYPGRVMRLVPGYEDWLNRTLVFDERLRATMATMAQPRSGPVSDSVVAYVADHAPELNPADVQAFITEHAKPTDEPGTPTEWAVRVLRERGEGEFGDGLPVDRVVGELRRRDDG